MPEENIATKISPEVRRLIAPAGTLRVGLYPGSPNSYIPSTPPEADKGLGYELGQALAQRLGVEFKPVFFKTNGEVLAAAKDDQVDFLLANATPSRAAYLAFTQPVLRIEQGYLVGADSNIEHADSIDQPHLKIGVSAGSTSESVLPKLLKQASVISADNLKDAADKMRAGTIHAFATNKAILFELSDQLDGSRVLKGAWGIEKISIGIPIKRQSALPFLQVFADDMQKKLFIQSP